MQNKPNPGHHPVLLVRLSRFIRITIALAAFASPAYGQIYSELWRTDIPGWEWNPATSRLKDFTNAGYMNGNVAIPNWPVGVNVTQPPYNAIPNDDVDDSAAFNAAIAACPANHAVFVPKGRYIIRQRVTINRDYVVVQGEDMFETVLSFPEYTNEAYVNLVGYDPADPDKRNAGVTPFFHIPGGTHRSIENLSFEFREQIKLGHWEHKGNDAILHSGTHSWLRNLYIKNADHAIATVDATNLSVVNIIFDQFVNRNKVRIETEGSVGGHMGINLNDTDDCLFHNLLFTGNWSHELDEKNNRRNVISAVRSEIGVVAYHGIGSIGNLYTELQVGGDYATTMEDSTRQSAETYWNVRSRNGFLGTDDVELPYNTDTEGNDHVFVGYGIDPVLRPSKTTTEFFYEAHNPSALLPQNIYLAQMAYRGKPVPPTPLLVAPNPHTGDVIRLEPVEDNAVNPSSPAAVVDPKAFTLMVSDFPYLKFDLRNLNLPTIHRVRLRLASSALNNAPFALGVYSVTDNTWLANELNFNNKPTVVALLDAVQINANTKAHVMEFDVTAFVQAQWAGDKMVSLALVKTSGNGSQSSILSSENGFGPELIIEKIPSTVPGAPSAPSEVRSQSLVGNIKLDWPDNPESDVVSYNVYRSKVSADSTQYDFPIGMGLTKSEFIDIQTNHNEGWDVGMVRNDEPYFYRVTAVDKHGYESGSSLEIVGTAIGTNDNTQPPVFGTSDIVLPVATQYLSYTASLAGSATDPESDPVYYSLITAPDWLTLSSNGTISGNPGHDDAGYHSFQVQANSLRGGRAEVTVNIQVVASVPNAPVFTDIVPGNASVMLDWSHMSEGLPGLTFAVYKSSVSGGPYYQIASALTASQFLANGLANGIPHHFVVTASNSNGESPESAEASATPINGLAIGTNFLGGTLTNAAAWDAGLPIGLVGRLDVGATVDTSILLDGFSVLHTGGSLLQSGTNPLTLTNGSSWVTDGADATTSTSFRGFTVKSGSSFTLNQGTIHTESGRDWSIMDAGSSLTVNGGTLKLGRSLLFSGSAGASFTINGGVILVTGPSGDIGARNINGNAKTLNFNGGTTTVFTIDLAGANTVFNFGGARAGSLTANGFTSTIGSNSYLNFLPGTQMVVTLSATTDWAETQWAAGKLRYNGQGVAQLGSWATVTSTGFGDGSKFIYDTGTRSLSLRTNNQSPAFTSNPIGLGNISEDSSFSGSISGNASDPDPGDTLSFSKTSGPAWLKVFPDGAISGKPANGDVGLNNFTVSVHDGKGGSANATLTVTVTNVNDAPLFNFQIIAGPTGTEDSPYSGSIAGSVSDADLGDSLSFSKTSGPAWLNVASNGTLSGTPANAHVGLNTFMVSVSDGNGGTASATLRITVINTNDAPVFGANPIVKASANENAAYSGSIAGSASDVDAGDSLSYGKQSGPAWLSVSSNGTLSGTPGNSDVGVNNFTVSVSDGNGGTANTSLKIAVLNVNEAPVFGASVIVGPYAPQGAAYTGTIAGSASDADSGDNLSYSKTGGPAWLSIAASGSLSGTPSAGDVGLNSFTVSVSDGRGGSASATLEITVTSSTSGTRLISGNINLSGNWTSGLPTNAQSPGTISVNGTVDVTYNGTFYMVQTVGQISGTGSGTNYVLNGGIFTQSGGIFGTSAFRGFNTNNSNVTTINSGSVLGGSVSDSTISGGSSLTVNGGTFQQYGTRRVQVTGNSTITINGGYLTAGGDIGLSRLGTGYGNTININGGTTQVGSLRFGDGGAQVTFNFGGASNGTFTAANYVAAGDDSEIVAFRRVNWIPRSKITMTLTAAASNWAQVEWEAGRLTYNGRGISTLGSWANVTSAGFGDGSMFVYDSGTRTLSLRSAPTAPIGLSANAGDSEVQLDWDANTEPDLSSYTVYRSLNSTSGYVNIATGVTGTSYVDQGLVNGTTYYYVVTAVDTEGHESLSSEAVAAVPINNTPPPAPLGLIVAAGDGVVFADWSDSTWPDFGSYTVYRSTTPGAGYVAVQAGLTSSSYTDNNVVNGSTYYYVVTAKTINGNESANSEQKQGTPNVGSVITTNFLGGTITNSASWDLGLPTDFLGAISMNATVDTSVVLNDYHILHTAGTIQQTGINALELINGSTWVTDGPMATTATSFRGFTLKSGSSFTLEEGTINTTSGRDWSVLDAGSTVTVNGGTLNLGRNLLLGGAAGPSFTINGGVVTVTGPSGDIGARSYQGNAKSFNFNGGTSTVSTIDLAGANTVFNFGGTVAGSLNTNGFTSTIGTNSFLNFLPGTQMSLRLSASDEWAAAQWAAGKLRYNGQGIAQLGSWTAVTTTGGLGYGYRFAYDSSNETLTLTSAPSLYPPVAANGSAFTNEDTSVEVTLDASDVDSSSLTYTVVTAPTQGVLSGTPPNLTYTPNANANGADSFTFIANDGLTDSNVATISLTVNAINDAPVAANGSAVTNEDAPVAVTLVATDIDSGSLTYTVVANPTKGVLSGTAPNLTYTPDANANGADSFTFKANDGTVDSNVATVNLTVNAVNDAPVVNAGADQTVELPTVPWTPAMITPMAWYDATDAATISASAGLVSQWNDKSGNANHMVQATSTKRPATGTSNINGFNAIAFDGTSDALKTATNPFGASISNAMVLAVVNIGTMTNSTMLSLTGSSTAANRWQTHCPWTGGNLYFDCGGSSGANRLYAPSGWSANQNKLMGYYNSTTDNVQQVWADGALKLSDATGHAVNTVSGISLGNDGSGNHDNCTMGEVVILNGVISAATRQKVEGYLAHKWGMAAALPSNHPYKNAAPMALAPGTVAILDGTASDVDGDALSTSWSVFTGPGPVTFGDATALDTTATFNTAGTYVLRLTANDPATQSYDDIIITVTSLPLPWSAADIGTGMLAGSDTYSSGTFGVTGSGVIGSTNDKQHYAYQMLGGDGEISARIRSLENTGTSSSVGVMIRDSLASNSMNVFMGMSGSNTYQWSRRTSSGGSTTVTTSGTGTLPDTWVRLVRSGTTITAYKSADGINWTTVGSITDTTLGSTCYIGLAVGSGSDTTLNTSQFSNVSVTP